MNLAEYDHQVWRKALHDLQIKIDDLDEAFWANVIDNNIVGTDAYPEHESKWKIERQKLVDELEAHHQSQPPLPS